jgi:hypothetical protein
MLREVDRCLTVKKFPFRRCTPTPFGQYHVTLSRRRELLRFLGSIRPLRLLDNFDPDVMGGLSGDSSRLVRLLEVKNVGIKSVVEIKTDCKTYIIDGLASHCADLAYMAG